MQHDDVVENEALCVNKEFRWLANQFLGSFEWEKESLSCWVSEAFVEFEFEWFCHQQFGLNGNHLNRQFRSPDSLETEKFLRLYLAILTFAIDKMFFGSRPVAVLESSGFFFLLNLQAAYLSPPVTNNKCPFNEVFQPKASFVSYFSRWKFTASL